VGGRPSAREGHSRWLDKERRRFPFEEQPRTLRSVSLEFVAESMGRLCVVGEYEQERAGLAHVIDCRLGASGGSALRWCR
jgi:hypothetical protein